MLPIRRCLEVISCRFNQMVKCRYKRSSIQCTAHILNQKRNDGGCGVLNAFLITKLMRGVHKVLVGKPEGKRPVGRPRRRWEDNIKTDLQEVGRGCGDWSWLRIGTGGGRLYGNELWGSIKCGEFLD